MESASVAAGTQSEPTPETGSKGLKPDAIGFLDGLCIGLASTAPAYSLAAVIGSIVVAVGIHAPGILLFAFVPMFFIAAAFYYMNRVDTDCGTTFSWVTRALGPYVGWMGGWAICTTGILVIGSLADVSALFLFDLLELHDLRKSDLANVVLAVAIIVVMTAICVIGTETSARLQRVLTFFQVGALLLFAVVAIAQRVASPRPSRERARVLDVRNVRDVLDHVQRPAEVGGGALGDPQRDHAVMAAPQQRDRGADPPQARAVDPRLPGCQHLVHRALDARSPSLSEVVGREGGEPFGRRGDVRGRGRIARSARTAPRQRSLGRSEKRPAVTISRSGIR